MHGGFWRSDTGVDRMRPLVAALVGAGFATWNIEYRKVDAGFGWSAPFDDVAAAVEHLAQLDVDAGRVYALGHSAGGHLALWLAARSGRTRQVPPGVAVNGVVSVAAMFDLVTVDGLGEPGEAAAAASPTAWLPLGVPSVCVHGTSDPIVPIEQSMSFVAAASAAGDGAELVRVDGADHMQVIDIVQPGWAMAVRALDRLAA
ncbi:alpha/beta fold hydrolase [Pseudonocardia alni]|nr:alpha/beta fold hydrolase [Pseudonocardia alni]